MKVTETGVSPALIIEPRRFPDNRGFFSETWSRRAFAKIGIDHGFVQDNHSLSGAAHTIRGLHFQAPPAAQAKLVRCGRGRLFDVAVDLRRGSPTFGRWAGAELSFENGRQFYVPAGFAHGFVTLEPDTEIIYKCSGYYAPEAERTIRFDDPEIGIDWGIDLKDAVLSDKDRAAAPLSEQESPFAIGDVPA